MKNVHGSCVCQVLKDNAQNEPTVAGRPQVASRELEENPVQEKPGFGADTRT